MLSENFEMFVIACIIIVFITILSLVYHFYNREYHWQKRSTSDGIAFAGILFGIIFAISLPDIMDLVCNKERIEIEYKIDSFDCDGKNYYYNYVQAGKVQIFSPAVDNIEVNIWNKDYAAVKYEKYVYHTIFGKVPFCKKYKQIYIPEDSYVSGLTYDTIINQ